MNKLFCALLTLVLISVSCTEWEEPQIDKEVIEILTPRDSLVTSVVTQLFFWSEVSDAIDYELQIVSPSFQQIDRFVLDTILTSNKFQFTLVPGDYEWSVRAFNNSSATPYTVHRLFIDSTIDLTTQTLQLISPSDFDTTNVLNKTFNWQNLYNADNYNFELWQPDETGQLVHQRTVFTDTLKYNLSAEGAYLWKVRAQNQLTNTVFSSRTFLIDTTAPNTPSLLEPDTNAVVSDNLIDFRWSRGSTNAGSVITDTLFLATDGNFINLTHTIPTRSTLFVLDTLSPGQYYWRVRSADAAGNSSSYSTTRTFTRN